VASRGFHWVARLSNVYLLPIKFTIWLAMYLSAHAICKFICNMTNDWFHCTCKVTVKNLVFWAYLAIKYNTFWKAHWAPRLLVDALFTHQKCRLQTKTDKSFSKGKTLHCKSIAEKNKQTGTGVRLIKSLSEKLINSVQFGSGRRRTWPSRHCSVQWRRAVAVSQHVLRRRYTLNTLILS